MIYKVTQDSFFKKKKLKKALGTREAYTVEVAANTVEKEVQRVKIPFL